MEDTRTQDQYISADISLEDAVDGYRQEHNSGWG